MPTSESQTEKELLGAIRRSGYPLEIQVVNTFRTAEWEVIPCFDYFDLDEFVHREIDLLARKEFQVAGGRSLQVEILVECKHSPQSQWVFFPYGPGVENPIPRHLPLVGTLDDGYTMLQSLIADLPLYDMPEPLALNMDAFGVGSNRKEEQRKTGSKKREATSKNDMLFRKASFQSVKALLGRMVGREFTEKPMLFLSLIVFDGSLFIYQGIPDEEVRSVDHVRYRHYVPLNPWRMTADKHASDYLQGALRITRETGEYYPLEIIGPGFLATWIGFVEEAVSDHASAEILGRWAAIGNRLLEKKYERLVDAMRREA